MPCTNLWICHFFIHFHPLFKHREREWLKKVTFFSPLCSCFGPSVRSHHPSAAPESCLLDDNVIYSPRAALISCNKSVELSRLTANREREKDRERREAMARRSVRRWNESNLELPGELCPIQLHGGVACQSRWFANFNSRGQLLLFFEGDQLVPLPPQKRVSLRHRAEWEYRRWDLGQDRPSIQTWHSEDRQVRWELQLTGLLPKWWKMEVC